MPAARRLRTLRQCRWDFLSFYNFITNLGLMHEAGGTIFREVAHQGMKKALGLGHHHRSAEMGTGSGGHSGGLLG